MTKSKVSIVLVLAVIIAILAAVFVLASCAAPVPAPAPEAKKMPAVEVVPNSVAPNGALEYIGSDFTPGEKVKVFLIKDIKPGKTEPFENAVAEGASGVQVDATGNFYIKTAAAPEYEGVVGVRVYDQNGNFIASSVFLVKAPPKK